MPVKPLLWLLCLFLFASVGEGHGQGANPALRPTLERAYNQWRAAVVARDPRAWAGAITEYRQVVTRNQIVSQRQPFPQAVFAVPMDPPTIEGLRLLEAQAVGPTAHLLYFGKINVGGDPSKIPDNVMMAKFFYERGSWKFDSFKLMRLEDQPEVRAQLQRGMTPDFLDYPEFTPPGKVPAVPPLCDPPEHMTGCTLQSYGYETKMKINAFDYPVMLDQAEKLLVIGGLKSGKNTVTLTVKPTEVPEGEERLLQVDLFVAPSKPGERATRVFHYQTKDANVSGTMTLPVVIDEEVLRKGR